MVVASVVSGFEEGNVRQNVCVSTAEAVPVVAGAPVDLDLLGGEAGGDDASTFVSRCDRSASGGQDINSRLDLLTARSR